jgi:hypothetical protein
VWNECQHMIRHYCEKFIQNPVGVAMKNTFLLNSRVVAKILSGTPLYVMEEDLENESGLPGDIKERLEDLNQRWLEINLARTIAFKIEMTESDAKKYRQKVDELNKLFDGLIHTGVSQDITQNEELIQGKITPKEAERMQTALKIIRKDFGENLEYSKNSGRIEVGGIQLPPSVLKNINVEVEQMVARNTMKAVMSGVWRKNEIAQISDAIGHTLDSDYRNLIVLWDMIKPSKIKLKRKIINPYSYQQVCGWTERENGIKILQCKTLIPHGRNRCELHNALNVAIQESEEAHSEFPLVFGHSKILYVKLPKPISENRIIEVNEGTRTESSANFTLLWKRQVSALKDCHFLLERNWDEFKPSEITKEKIEKFNNNFTNSSEGNWYFELFNLMERVKLELNHPTLGISNRPIEWALIEKSLENVKKVNDAQAQFQGLPGNYLKLMLSLRP